METVHSIILNFLASQGYNNTLAAYKKEADLDDFPINSSLDLRSIVAAYLDSQLAAKLSRTTLKQPSASELHLDSLILSEKLPTAVTKTLKTVHLGNVLSVSKGKYCKRWFDTKEAIYKSSSEDCIISTSTDKTVKFISKTTWEMIDTFEYPGAVLSCTQIPSNPRLLICGTMDGTLVITDMVTRTTRSLKHHSKYIVRIVVSSDGKWIATASYDKSINIYELEEEKSAEDQDIIDTDEFASTPNLNYTKKHTLPVASNPEAILFLPDSPHLVFSCRDSNYLNYMDVEDDFKVTPYNLNENQDSHVSFCILSIGLHPSGMALSLQTDTTLARILLVPFHSTKRLIPPIYTSSAQSEYSNPRHAWLPSGAGVAVTSDDGIVRIVDLKGQVKALYGAHGIAGPRDEDELSLEGLAQRAREALRARWEQDKGSSVVRDIAVLDEGTVITAGLDKTIRIARP